MKGNLSLQEFHETPPLFNAMTRKQAFFIDDSFNELVLDKIRTNQNKAYATVMYAYFNDQFQFFDTAHQKDLDYAAAKFDLYKTLTWSEYNKDAKRAHKKLILNYIGFHAFSKSILPTEVFTLINQYANERKNMKLCFEVLAKELKRNKIEIPSFITLYQLISDIYEAEQNRLISIINTELPEEAKLIIDNFFTRVKYKSQTNAIRLSLVKKFSHKQSKTAVDSNLAIYDDLEEIFNLITPTVKKLGLSVEALKHYGTSVNKSRIFQLTRKDEKDLYLHMMCFITHQFRRLQDHLADTLMAIVKNAINQARKKAKEQLYEYRNKQNEHVNHMVADVDELVKKLTTVGSILEDENLSNDEKVSMSLAEVKKVLQNKLDIETHVDNVKIDQKKLSGDALFYQFLSEACTSIINRCQGITMRLCFGKNSINRPLLLAVEDYQKCRGKLVQINLLDFLNKKEMKSLIGDDTLTIDLYKVVLYQHIADAIVGDGLHLIHSYKYMLLDDYLINKQDFENNLDDYLEENGMIERKHFINVLNEKDMELHAQFTQTNEHILEAANPFIIGNKPHELRTSAPRTHTSTDLNELQAEVELFLPEANVPLNQVVNVVAEQTGFLDCFQHFSGKDIKQRPNKKTMIAAIISAACNFNPSKFSQLCGHINNSSLATANNNYLSDINASLASDKVIQYVDRMALPSLFLFNGENHTSSDGMKEIMGVASLNSAPSFKYGGNHDVFSRLSAIDARHLNFYSEVMHPRTREAHYVVDCLLHNQVVQSDLHATDQHGYTEVLCAIMDLLSMNFAPRIAKILKAQLYSIRPKKDYVSENYPILPDHKINQELIEPNWTDILRFITTLKTGKATASQLFKRLNSYSSENHPLYNALREYGRIIKTIHVLRYIDDAELRDAIKKQLNKGESSNSLDRALSIGRSEIGKPDIEDQQIMDSCKRLVKNCIVCWNYMYFTNRFINLKRVKEKIAFIDKLRSSSPVAWEHIIIHGQFDYSEQKLKDSIHFNYEKLLDPNLLTKIRKLE